MTNSIDHLTEGERQMLADGSLSPEDRPALEQHLRDCGECAADVERLRAFLSSARRAPGSAPVVDALWPAVRATIEARKVLPLTAAPLGTPASAGRRRLKAWGGGIGALAAAVFVVLVVRGGDSGRAGGADAGPPAPSVLIAAADSAHVYEAEAQALLDRLELQRALLRPEASRALARDLEAIDVAIAELKDAIARDPGNPALRQLLASSYRQKVELLKRAGNAS